MRILLISVNRERIPDAVAPIGCAYVLQTLIHSGHEVSFFDLLPFSSSRQALLELGDHVLSEPWDLVAISVRNLDASVEPQRRNTLPWISQVVKHVRKNSVAPILMGGSGFSLLPERLLEILDIDFGITGPCEQSLPKFLQNINSPEQWKNIPGLVYRSRGQQKIICNPSKPWGIPAQGPIDGWKMMNRQYYYDEGGAINVQTRRGCQFRCTFCTYPKLEGNLVLQRDPHGIVDELVWWKDHHGVKHFFFVDSVFNAPWDHTELILNEIINRKLKISWTAYVNPLGLTASMIELMLNSGCIGIEMGIDSGSDLVLRKLKKGFLPKQVRQSLNSCCRMGLKSCVNLIFGSPGENLETVRETIDLLNEFPHFPVISMVGVRIYPGTPIYQMAKSEGVINKKTDLLNPTFYFSPHFDEGCMQVLLHQAKIRKNWVIPDEQVNTNIELFQKLRRRKMKGPLWRVLRAEPLDGSLMLSP